MIAASFCYRFFCATSQSPIPTAIHGLTFHESQYPMNDVNRAKPATVNAQIVPAGTLDVLSRDEIARLRDA
ncbi:MAG TPA: hypothetical protein VJQ42_04400, partial [Rhodanobacteraceae bacterium]|nr:hypothetical protein [Rhodanobacteraceae bacterium]